MKMSTSSTEETTEDGGFDDTEVMPIGRLVWSPDTDVTLMSAVDEQTQDRIDWTQVAEAMTRSWPRVGGWTSKQVRYFPSGDHLSSRCR